MRVGISGSYKPERNSAARWPTKSTPKSFAAACRSIGAALGAQKIELVVGSDGAVTADRFVVEGYIERTGSNGHITVLRPRARKQLSNRAPQTERPAPFLEVYEKNPKPFVYQEAVESDWRHTRQEFIERCDAILTICGGDGTYQTGLEARLAKRKLVPVGSFGGASLGLFDKLMQLGGVLKPERLAKLANPWAPGLADVVVEALGANDPIRVFLIHGHSGEKDAIAKWLKDQRSIEAIVLAEEFTGETLLQMLQEAVGRVQGAVALVSADDIGYSLREPKKREKRARQNVWLEMGWFYGALGTNRVFALVEEGVAIPSNLGGMFLQQYRKSPMEHEAQLRRFLQRLAETSQ